MAGWAGARVRRGLCVFSDSTRQGPVRYKGFMVQLPNVQFVYLFPRPINIRWGEAKLIELCKTEMGIDPKRGGVFLFFNRKKDQLKLFFLDDTGSQELLKLLPRGGFMVPVPRDGEKFVKISVEKLNSLFRTGLFS